MYIEWDKDNKSFGLLHCYTILKGEDKWKAKMIELAEIEKEKQANKKKQKPSSKVSRPRDDEVNSEDHVIQVDSEPKYICRVPFLHKVIIVCFNGVHYA